MDTDFLFEQMKLYNTSIENIGFSDSVLRCLRWHEYKTVGKLARMKYHKLAKIPGLNENDCNEIVEKLDAMGIIIDGKPENTPKQTYGKPGKYPYPKNLIAAIMDTDPERLADENYSIDRFAGISAALSSLSEQEETMIILRYKYGATLTQIGNYYGVTKERARQLILEGIHKLRHFKRFQLIDKGLHQYIDDEAKKLAEMKVYPMLHSEYTRGYRDGIEDATKAEGDKKYLIDEKILQTPISDVDMSVRSYNILKMASINKLGDILAFNTVEAICSMKNMGKKSAAEIAKILRDHGICNKAWAHFLIDKKEE